MRHLLLAAICVAAFAGNAGAQNFRIALREDPDSLDPTTARTYVSRIVFAGMCDKLFDINEKLEIVPQLATSYEWTDPKTLVIKLRQGVVFHDGEKMTAEAVKYSLERHLTMQGSFRRSEINVLDRVEVVDPQTVKLVLKGPSAPFLAQLTDRAGMIVSPKAAEAAGKDFTQKPVCAGPFRFVERVPQDHITLERFPQYWDAGNIKLERVVYQTIPDSSIRLANLQAGSIDLSEQILPTDVAAARKAGLKLAIGEGLGYNGINLNLANGPAASTAIGQSALVRHAFELALDRATLNQVVYDGLYTPTAQANPPNSPFFVASLVPPARDLARAKELLKQAGVPLPVPVVLTVTNGPDLQQAAEIIQAMEAEAGFDVKVKVMEFASSLQAGYGGDFQAYMIGWSGRVDPDGNMWQLLHSRGTFNYGKWSNPEADKLLDAARLASDLGQRRELYSKFWELERQDLPLIYLWTTKNLVAMKPGLQGFRQVPDGLIRLGGLRVQP
jgi:peptide/nickel transport system substrate-binding protein